MAILPHDYIAANDAFDALLDVDAKFQSLRALIDRTKGAEKFMVTMRAGRRQEALSWVIRRRAIQRGVLTAIVLRDGREWIIPPEQFISSMSDLALVRGTVRGLVLSADEQWAEGRVLCFRRNDFDQFKASLLLTCNRQPAPPRPTGRRRLQHAFLEWRDEQDSAMQSQPYKKQADAFAADKNRRISTKTIERALATRR